MMLPSPTLEASPLPQVRCGPMANGCDLAKNIYMTIVSVQGHDLFLMGTKHGCSWSFSRSILPADLFTFILSIAADRHLR